MFRADTLGREADYKIFTDIVEQVMLAEELGFDTIWAVEHTALSYYAHMSAPETFLAYIAGRTKRIGIGHGVICLPVQMNHPVKVAERCATLDILSNGRLHVGFGKGGTQQESGTFGYDIKALPPMISEAMRVVPRVWLDDPFEYHGEFIDVPARPIHPKPLQKPHPPLYMACTHDESIIDAGKRGIGALVLGFGGPEQVAAKNAKYRAAYAGRKREDQVGERPTEHLAALCPTVVLDDDGPRARRIGLRGQRFFMESISHWASAGAMPLPDPSTWADDLATTTGDGTSVISASIGSELVTVDFADPALAMLNPNHAYGTVSDCIGYVTRLIEAGADEILFLNQMGTVPQDVMMETVRSIGTHVIPYFRSGDGSALAAGC